MDKEKIEVKKYSIKEITKYLGGLTFITGLTLIMIIPIKNLVFHIMDYGFIYAVKQEPFTILGLFLVFFGNMIYEDVVKLDKEKGKLNV